ncbi:MAG: c-type cytochrome [Gemmatimonadetes bacterium]|nr:c-type cytochrome [Gemmatimonadota bacterium]
MSYPGRRSDARRGFARARALAVVFAGIAAVAAPAAGTIARQAGRFEPRPLSPFERRKAEELIRRRYPCLGCHELGAAGGRIGPRLTDVGTRRSAAYIHAMISNPQHSAPGTIMPRVPMPPATIDLLASYLSSGGGTGAFADTARKVGTLQPAAGDAPAVYGRYCAPCHGTEGKGDGPNATFLPIRPSAHASAARMSVRSDDALFDTIFSGGYIMNRSNLMPPFGATLTREDIWGLVRHIRTLCRCQGPTWSRARETR